MEFKELVHERYAVREYNNRKIDDKDIGEIIELVRLSPSGLNLQPWKIKIIHDNNIKEKLYQNSSKLNRHIASCSHLLVFCVDTEIHVEKIIRIMGDSGLTENDIKDYEELVSNYMDKLTLDDLKRYVYIAVVHGVYAAKSVGIDSCIIGGFDPDIYSEILDLPSNLNPTLLITLGYAADKPGPKIRLAKEDILF
jgi:Nitroreductase